MTHKIAILTVERGRELAQRLNTLFDDNKVDIFRVSSMDHVLERFETEVFDVLIISYTTFQSGAIDGVELLDVIAVKSPMTQVLFLADAKDLRMAMSALKAGSYQYVKLPVSDEELQLLIETALEKRPRYGPNLLLEEERKEVQFEQLVGQSVPMKAVYRQIRQAASTDMPVLLMGETGTGKDLAAQAIHSQSQRSEGPYIPVNLGALPAELVASELFGHEKGAFTGAMQKREGKFELAIHGSVFLDEIATVDEKVQIGLLRLIEQKTFSRLGGKHAISTDARLITASNEDLEELVQRGAFREDLYYRLDVFRIEIPPLRERTGDIALLVDVFLKRYNQSFQKNILGIAPECISLLESYNWPGNVRELKNVIQRAVLVAGGDVLVPEHLPPRFRPDQPVYPTITFRVGTSLDEVERQMIVRALTATQNNRKEAAELLGISRRALYNKLKKHDIQ
ncbi:sigma-54-dependent transcriptional regulator [Planctomycetota bacterium]